MATATQLHLALLRGINVGGKNVIPMAALKACFEERGFTGIATYIQSGNVLFDPSAAGKVGKARLTGGIEAMLSAAFGYDACVVLLSHEELREIVTRAPAGFGREPATYRYDVIFLKDPLTAAEAIKSVTLKEGVDAAAAGPGALYFSRLIARAAQSHLSRIVARPVYRSLTIRNWNTTTKLLALLDARGGTR